MFKIKFNDIKFNIRIITYPRDGRTKNILPNTLQSILKQTYKNWEIYLFGDNYQPKEELLEISSIIPDKKIKIRNLDVNSERFHYKGMDLWYCGGVNACNYVLDWMQKDEVKIVALCNDDDIWLPNHLETLAMGYNKFPEASFVYTRGNHLQMGDLPVQEINGMYYDNKPVEEHNTIFSATSWRLDKINLRFRNCVKQKIPADADLWQRMREFCFKNKLKFLYIPKNTVQHESHKPFENSNEISMKSENTDSENIELKNKKYKRNLLF